LINEIAVGLLCALTNVVKRIMSVKKGTLNLSCLSY
jgi:hypothetical protein